MSLVAHSQRAPEGHNVGSCGGGYRYTIHLKANAILERKIVHLLKRPVGRPPHKPLVRHARYVTFQMAEVAVPRELYRALLRRIAAFAAKPVRAAPI